MILRRIYEEHLAQASYLVACDHARVGLIVDPNRDIDLYVEIAAREKIRILAVTETHIHADFVSGARELARRTGAQLYLSDGGGMEWKYGFAKESHAELLTDGSTFEVGDVHIEAVHTPGHTPEHMSFLVTDTSVADQPMGALTGDFIFVGDVGRPDLLERAAGFQGTMEAGARRLFQSLKAFKEKRDYLQIWPGHGAGSACGKALGAMPQSTLGYERLFNWGLAEDDEERFVATVLEGQPEPPAYFATMKRVNRDGPGPASSALPPVASRDDLVRAIGAQGPVVDTRLEPPFAASHASGTVNIPRNKSFLNWAGALLPYDRPLLYIGDASDEGRQRLVHDLSLIGIDSIAGVFPAAELEGADLETTTTPTITIAAAVPPSRHTFLDVRGRSEFAAGHIPGAVNIPLIELQRRMDEVPAGPVVVHCQGGSRSAIASSVLQRSGKTDIANLVEGFDEWARTGQPVEHGGVTG